MSDELSIVPLPARLERRPGFFRLTSSTKIVIASGGSKFRDAAEILSSEIERVIGMRLPTAPDEPSDGKPGIVKLSIVRDYADDEAYRLEVHKDQVHILAGDYRGLIWGIRTLIQLFRDNRAGSGGEIPCLFCEDHPRFRWRGMHLDVARHFFPVEFILKYVELLSHHKLNMFHWHLTDDQGWRIKIERYPRLTEVGAWRRLPDGSPYGGFYSQAEIRRVVEHARRHGVEVVPEIDLPGHATAALAAYPEYACRAKLAEVATGWGIFDNTLCPSRDETYEFVAAILEELVDLFPSRFVHVGGDECPSRGWAAHERCCELMAREKLSDAAALQGYFNRRVEAILERHARRPVGWDEILGAGAASGAVVMCWRDARYAVAAARAGHDVVMSPQSHCYFDHYQAKSGEPKAIGGYLPLETVYAFEPIPEVLTSEEATCILGGQGNVWTEYMETSEHVEYMAFPRMCALSEKLWSPAKSTDWADFCARLKRHSTRLDGLGVNYRRG